MKSSDVADAGDSLSTALQLTLANLFGHPDSVEGGEYAGGSSPHVVALTPQILRLVQHQHRVICL